MKKLLLLATAILCGVSASRAAAPTYLYALLTSYTAPGPATMQIAVIDYSSAKIVKNIPLSGESGTVFANPNGAYVYALQGDGVKPQVLTVIAAASNTVVRTVTLKSTAYPSGGAVTPDGKYIWVLNDRAETISVYCAITYQLLSTISTVLPGQDVQFPVAIAFSPNGTSAYVVTGGDFPTFLQVFANSGSKPRLATVQLNDSPSLQTPISVSPDGAYVYTAVNNFGTVWIVSTKTYQVVDWFSPGEVIPALAANPNGKQLYLGVAPICCHSGENMQIYGVPGFALTSVEPLQDRYPVGVVFSPDGSHAFAALQSGPSNPAEVTIFSTANNMVSGHIPFASAFEPLALAILQ